MGQIGATLGNLVGIGQNAGVNTFGANPYGQDYGAQTAQQQANLQAANAGQTALLGQLQNISQGNGPNPAQAMLAQQTGQNMAQQGALQAGQRGASQNVGLIARNAGQQGAQIQQQAAGQGATMQAQQQLGALGQQAGVLGQQGQQAVGGLGAYESAINAANQVNAGSAAQRAQFGQGFGGGLLQGVGSMIAEGGYAEDAPKVHFDDGGMASDNGSSFIGQFLSNMGGGSTNSATGTKQNKGLAKGLLSSVFSKSTTLNPTTGASSLGANATYNQSLTPFGNSLQNAPGMAAGNAGFAGGAADAGGAAAADASAGAAGGADAAELLAAEGGRVPALVSPGEHKVPRDSVRAVANGKVSPLKVGETFPGKPKVKGNSYSNDILPRKLAAGDVIIPNKIMQSKNPERGAAEFVRDVLAKKRKKA